ncbi:hypothetical protein, partial [Anaerotruncus sp. AF02-27]|uniref:hypothetical protein n=1 Tax=Anaerotruncus sp. AF02-27 TaxID=2292191 RepID=UPI001A9A5BDC
RGERKTPVSALRLTFPARGAQNAGFSPELTVCWERLRRKFWQGVRGVSKGAASHFGVLFGYFLAQARKYARGARRNAPVILKRQCRLIPVRGKTR